ncbi:MAG: hypothetical protein PHG19_02385 [Anaerotignum sp.]|nr:hypothetical protein [Anaerotignum sp.]
MGSSSGAKSSSASISAAAQAGAALVGSSPTAKMGLAIVGNVIAKEISGKENSSLSKESAESKSSTGAGTNVAEKSSSGSGNSRVSNISKSASGILSSINANSTAKVSVGDKIKAAVKSTVSTLSETVNSLSAPDTILVTQSTTSGITYAGRDAGALEIINNINNNNIPQGNNFFTTKTDDGDKLKEQEQKFYDNVNNAMDNYSSNIENKSEGNSSENNNNFTTKVEVSDEYSSKSETNHSESLNIGKKYTNDPLHWASELENNVKSKISKLSPNMSEEVKERIENALIQKEKKELQNKYSTAYNASDNWLSNAMSTITRKPSLHETLEPLFKDNDKKTTNIYLSAFASGAKDGFNFGLLNEVTEAAINTKVVSQLTNKIGKLVKKNDDEVKAIVETTSKKLDEAKEIEMVAKSGIEGGAESVAGANRAAKFAENWQKSNLDDAIEKFAPDAKPVSTSSGKTLYKNEETGIQVVYDKSGNYFRVEDTTLTGKRRYLDLDGNNVSNKIVDGKQMGRTKDEYEAITHFSNIK